MDHRHGFNAEGLGVNLFEVFAASSGRRPLSRSGIDPLRLLNTMQKAVSNPASLEVLEGYLRLSPENQSKIPKLIKRLLPKPGSKKKRQLLLRQAALYLSPPFLL